MHTATLRKIGGSVGLSLPAAVVKALDFRLGEQVEVFARDGEMVLKAYQAPDAPRRRRSKYTLDELLARCDFSLPMSLEEREWLDAPAVGREEI